MTRFSRLLLSSAAVLVAPEISIAQETAEAVSAELPPVVVEGATLDVKPPAKPRRQPAPIDVEQDAQTNSAPAAPPETAGTATPTASVSAIEPFGPAGDRGDAGSSGVDAKKIGSAVTVVSGADLRAQQIRSAADALRSLPGVAVSRSGGFNGFTQIRIRGAEGNHTLVLIDGIEANDTTNGEFDFSDLSADSIERMEVIRGPQSGLYGSSAVGGVVNIVTKSGRGPLTFSAYGEGGSFNSKGGAINVSGGNDRFWGSVTLGARETDGFDIAPFGNEDDGSELKTLNIRTGAQILPGVTLDLTLRHTNKQGDRDTQAPFPDPNGIQVDDPASFQDKSLLGSVRLTWESFDGHLVQTAKATRNETNRKDESVFFGTPNVTENNGERETYNYAATYRLDTPALLQAQHFFTGLVEHEDEAFTPQSDFGFGFAADGIERTRSLDAAAFEYRGEYFDTVFLQGTVRRDDSNIFGDFTTWRTALSVVVPRTGLRPHASYGTGVKLPTMFETFGSIPGSYYPNPDLQPEKSEGWDAGVEFTIVKGFAVVDVTYFDLDVTNKIRSFANCRIAPAPFFSECTAVNDPGTTPRQGVEVAGSFYLGSGLTLGVAYTFTDALDVDGLREIRRPEHSGRADLSYLFDDGRGLLNVSAQYVGDTIDTNFGDFSRVALERYWLVNVAAAYKLTPGIELFGRVENLLDEDYQEIYGFETAGIAAYAGMRFTFEEPLTAEWAKYR